MARRQQKLGVISFEYGLNASLFLEYDIFQVIRMQCVDRIQNIALRLAEKWIKFSLLLLVPSLLINL